MHLMEKIAAKPCDGKVSLHTKEERGKTLWQIRRDQKPVAQVTANRTTRRGAEFLCAMCAHGLGKADLEEVKQLEVLPRP